MQSFLFAAFLLKKCLEIRERALIAGTSSIFRLHIQDLTPLIVRPQLQIRNAPTTLAPDKTKDVQVCMNKCFALSAQFLLSENGV